MFQLLWSVGALLPCEDYLHITISFSLKIDSELGLLCWFEKPAVIEAITTGFKTKTDSEGPYRQLSVVKNIKNLARLRFERGSRGRECAALTAELG